MSALGDLCDRIAERVTPGKFAALLQLEGSNGKYRCIRPENHENGDRSPSLEPYRKGDRTTATCHPCGQSWTPVNLAAEVWGCEPVEAARRLADSLGLDASALDERSHKPSRRPEATYDYVDENGEVLFQAVRYEPKGFSQRRPDGNGGWIGNVKGVRRVPYRLPEVIEAVALDKTVYIAEGEKDVHAIERVGGVATCNPEGAGKWKDEYSSYLADASVVVVADKDKAGYRHAQEVLDSLEGVTASVKVVEASEGKDAYDHLESGGTLEDFAPIDRSTLRKLCEVEQPAPPAKAKQEGTGEPPDPKRTLEAERLLLQPNLLDLAAEEMARRGLQREGTNLRVIFLSGVAGHLGDPFHLVIHGGSSGGKNTLMRDALQLLPEDRVLAITGLTAHALEYRGGRIEGVLAIDEAEGGKDAEYTLRQAMSEGRIRRLVTNRGASGGNEGQEISIEIPASIITTTTSAALHAENQTRVFDLWIDDSEEQTRRVMAASAAEAAGESREPDPRSLEVWRTAISLLEPARVVIPYAPKIARAFPSHLLRARRDFKRFLVLLRAHTLLYQKQRERDGAGRIVATVEDYRAAYPLIQAVLSASMTGLNETALKLFDLRDELAKTKGDEWVRRIDLEKEAAVGNIASRNTVHMWSERLSSPSMGIWEARKGERGALEYRKLRDAHSMPFSLPSPEELLDPKPPKPPSASQMGGGRPEPTSDGAFGLPPKPPNDTPDTDTEHKNGDDPFPNWEDWEATEKPRGYGNNASHPSFGTLREAWEAEEPAPAPDRCPKCGDPKPAGWDVCGTCRLDRSKKIREETAGGAT